MKAQIYNASAEIVENDGMHDPMLQSQASIAAYVMHKAQEWTDFVESNFYDQWDEYYRLWRGLWAAEDKTRESERSRIVTPALQQAVESSVAEVEEATFGHGQLFDIKDDIGDQNPQDIAQLREKMQQDFRKQKVRKAVSEVLINAAVYGTGIAEIVVEEERVMTPATEPMMDGQLEAVGVRTEMRPMVKMKPIQCRNFLIDPVATSVDGAHGVAIDEFVPAHTVRQLQASGAYRKVDLGPAAHDEDIEANPELDTYPYEDKVRILKYYGLVPRHLLELAEEGYEDAEVVSLEDIGYEDGEEPEKTDDEYWVEAVVVVANQGIVLKAEESPFMMQDRPVVAFQWDIVPGQFWGRGVCEKGFNSQKALDAEIRARIDALALTIHPMMAMDATRIPRGHKPQVRPGKMLLTNGNPRDVLSQFTFGNVDQITFAQAAELQKMVQQSTGAVDASGLPGTVNGEATAAGISMSLGAIIKRQKRTLLNFQEGFWIPFVQKAAWRYMQFSPDQYPISDFDFVPTSTLGIMAREYEVTQLVQLLQTTSDQSPMYGAIIEAIVENMNVSNREALIATLRQAAQPDPKALQRAEEAHQAQMREQAAKVGVFEAQANESNARAHKYSVEAELEPRKVENDRMDAVADVREDVTNKEFEQRLRLAEVKLKERDINVKEKGLELQAQDRQQQQKLRDSLSRDS